MVVLGPSGSGKSTFLNILATLDRPTSVEVLFQGKNLFTKSNEELAFFRRQNVGLVFQFFNLIPTLTALENVELMASLSESAMSAEEALQRLQLWERRNHFPGELSGGEQRVRIQIDFEHALPEQCPSGLELEAHVEVARSENTLISPLTAVWSENEQSFIFVVLNNKLLRREVRTDLRSQQEVEVLAGLDGTETIVRFPSSAMKEGLSVSTRI